MCIKPIQTFIDDELYPGVMVEVYVDEHSITPDKAQDDPVKKTSFLPDDPDVMFLYGATGVFYYSDKKVWENCMGKETWRPTQKEFIKEAEYVARLWELWENGEVYCCVFKNRLTGQIIDSVCNIYGMKDVTSLIYYQALFYSEELTKEYY